MFVYRAEGQTNMAVISSSTTMVLPALSLVLAILTAQGAHIPCQNNSCHGSMYCDAGQCRPCSFKESTCHTGECGRYCLNQYKRQLKEGLTCERPPHTDHADYNTTKGVGDGYRYGDKVHTICHRGYHANGETINTCGVYGIWQHDFPKCVQNECPMLSYIKHGIMHMPSGHKSFKVGMNLSFTCDEFHVLEGVSTITCEPNGTWSAPPPRCREIRCSVQKHYRKAIHNGTSDLSPLETLKFQCGDKQRIVGSNTLTCLPGGTWNQPFPTCEDITCPEIPMILNGDCTPRNSGTTHEIGSMVFYECHPGFSMFGDQHRLWKCLPNGKWDRNILPMCIKDPEEDVMCSEPMDILHGNHNTTGDSPPGESVQFACSNGFEIIGVEIITCKTDGTWNLEPPECKAMVCNLPPFVEDGNIAESDLTEIIVGTKIHYGCNEGFRMKNRKYSVWTCIKQGNQTTYDKRSLPVCVWIANEGHKCTCFVPFLLLILTAGCLVCSVIWVVMLKYTSVCNCVNTWLGRAEGETKYPLLKNINTNEHVTGDKISIKGNNQVIKLNNPIEEPEEDAN